MTNTEMLISAMTSGGGGGGGVEIVNFESTFDDVARAASSGKRVVFSDNITIESPLAPVSFIIGINGVNYIDLTPLGGSKQYVFNTLIDATDEPMLGKVLSITVRFFADNSSESRVTYIDPAT